MANKSKQSNYGYAPATEKSAAATRFNGMLCDELSFSAAEAYKLLRANLMFTMPKGEACHIVGISSPIRAEGKSTTAINLSYTFAETGKRVLLIDADMRLPSIAKKLQLEARMGLSNLLAGLCTVQEAVLPSEQLENWYILTSGDIPPNPSELLGTEAMGELLEKLSKVFDYIVIDLPPINIVSDALVVSRWTDGLVLIVRQNHTSRPELNACLDQLRIVEAKLLGVVMTDAGNDGTGYYSGRYGKRYGKYYKKGYSYGYGYAEKSGRSGTVTRKK